MTHSGTIQQPEVESLARERRVIIDHVWQFDFCLNVDESAGYDQLEMIERYGLYEPSTALESSRLLTSEASRNATW